MDVREKLVEICFHEFCMVAGDSPCGCDGCPYGKYGSDDGECYEEYKKSKLEKLEKAGATVQEWISVDDRLPENDVMVIGYTPCDGLMFVGYYHEEPKYDWKVWRIVTAMRSTKVMTKKVTHWMPLPQPPKGE